MDGSPKASSMKAPPIHINMVIPRTTRTSLSTPRIPPRFSSSLRVASMSSSFKETLAAFISVHQVTGNTNISASRPYFIQSMNLQTLISARNSDATALEADPVIVAIPPTLAA